MNAKTWKSYFFFFTDSKQHESCKVDMITLRNHALRSHMTWFPVALSVLDMIVQLWHHRHWFRKFTVGFRPIRKELEFNVYSFLIRLHCSWIFVKPFSSNHYQTSYLDVFIISQSEILTIIVNSTILILKLCSISN